MVKLQDLAEFLDKYLEINDVSDNAWNGLQVEGKDKIKKIIVQSSKWIFYQLF